MQERDEALRKVKDGIERLRTDFMYQEEEFSVITNWSEEKNPYSEELDEVCNALDVLVDVVGAAITVDARPLSPRPSTGRAESASAGITVPAPINPIKEADQAEGDQP